MAGDRKIVFDEDIQLMLLTVDGNASAFTKLYDRYFPIVKGYVVSLNKDVSSDDIAQEVFTRIWKYRAKYQPTSALKSFLFGYAIKVLMEERVRLTKAMIINCDALICDLAALYRSSDQTVEIYQEDTLKQAMIQLTTKQEQAIRLTYYEEMPLRKAARHAACSVETLRSRLRRARKRLIQLLECLESQDDEY